MARNPFEEDGTERKREVSTKWSPTMTKLVQLELYKILKGKQVVRVEQVNFAHIEDFASNVTLGPLCLINELPKY